MKISFFLRGLFRYQPKEKTKNAARGTRKNSNIIFFKKQKRNNFIGKYSALLIRTKLDPFRNQLNS